MEVESFITYIRCELALSAHTVLSYTCDLDQWRDFATGGHPEEFDPQSVTLSDLRLFVSHLSASGVSQRSIRRKISAIRSFYRYMMRRHGYTTNPAADITFGRTPRSLPAFIPTDEMNSVLNERFNEDDFVTFRNHLIVNTLYTTGMRSSELTGLRDANVDTTRRELKVLGKRNKERIIPFGDELAAMIDHYRKLRTDMIASTSTDDRPVQVPDTLFVTPSLKPMTHSMVYGLVRRQLAGRVHASRVSPHVLRHSFATDMLNNGASINAVQQLLGHKSLATTQIYTHISTGELISNYQLAHPRALKKGGIHGS